MNERAGIVIVGAGVIGASIAYHLARRGAAAWAALRAAGAGAGDRGRGGAGSWGAGGRARVGEGSDGGTGNAGSAYGRACSARAARSPRVARGTYVRGRMGRTPRR